MWSRHFTDSMKYNIECKYLENMTLNSIVQENKSIVDFCINYNINAVMYFVCSEFVNFFPCFSGV